MLPHLGAVVSAWSHSPSTSLWGSPVVRVWQILPRLWEMWMCRVGPKPNSPVRVLCKYLQSPLHALTSNAGDSQKN